MQDLDTFANLIAYSPPLGGTEFLNWSTHDTFSPWGQDGQLNFGTPEIDSLSNKERKRQ